MSTKKMGLKNFKYLMDRNCSQGLSFVATTSCARIMLKETVDMGTYILFSVISFLEHTNFTREGLFPTETKALLLISPSLQKTRNDNYHRGM